MNEHETVVELLYAMIGRGGGDADTINADATAIVEAIRSNDSDRDVAIGEHAFRAGFSAGQEWGSYDSYLRNGRSDEQMVAEAWNEYTPPEDLCGGGTNND